MLVMASNESGYELFRDCFSNALLQRMSTPSKAPRKRQRRKDKGKDGDGARAGMKESSEAPNGEKDTEQLAEFIEFLAFEIFESLPGDLQSLSYAKVQEEPQLKEEYDPNEANVTTSALSERLLACVPPSVWESLSTYELLAADTSFPPLFTSAVSEFITSATAPPPVWSSTRTTECEICGRDWIPLTYHHLIPKSTHERVLKRGWHEEWVLNSVAWLCRACHSFVHRCENNEMLAKEYYTVDLLLGREDVQHWAKWVGRVRWRAR